MNENVTHTLTAARASVRPPVRTSDHTRYRSLVDRVALAGLALTGAVVGPLALFVPASFYRDLPGGGHAWVAADGPFSEHLVRDVGALYLAIGVLALAALVGGDRRTARVTGLVWLVFSVPHLAYHAGHLDVYAGADRALNVVALASSVLLAAVLMAGCPGVTSGAVR